MSPDEFALIKFIDNNTYEALKKLFCPYCNANLPTTLASHKWVHSIPGTSHSFECEAKPLRNFEREKNATKSG